MNPKTIEAMKEAWRGGLKRHASTKAMLRDMKRFDYERVCAKLNEHVAVIEKVTGDALTPIDSAALTTEDAKAFAEALASLQARISGIRNKLNDFAFPAWRGEASRKWQAEQDARSKRSDEREARRSASEAAFKLKIRGIDLGEIWSDEFEQYRRNGAFEAALFERLSKHAQASEPTKVKNMVKGAELAKMIAEAEKQAGGKYTGQKS